MLANARSVSTETRAFSILTSSSAAVVSLVISVPLRVNYSSCLFALSLMLISLLAMESLLFLPNSSSFQSEHDHTHVFRQKRNFIWFVYDHINSSLTLSGKHLTKNTVLCPVFYIFIYTSSFNHLLLESIAAVIGRRCVSRDTATGQGT